MLIGPSLTLAAFEEKLNDRSYELKMELPKLQKEFNRLRGEFKLVPRTAEDEDGEEITNPDFLAIPKRMAALEETIKDYQEQQLFMDSKLAELEDIEERSKGRGNVNKEVDKITLSLTDCVKLGITV